MKRVAIIKVAARFPSWGKKGKSSLLALKRKTLRRRGGTYATSIDRQLRRAGETRQRGNCPDSRQRHYTVLGDLPDQINRCLPRVESSVVPLLRRKERRRLPSPNSGAALEPPGWSVGYLEEALAGMYPIWVRPTKGVSLQPSLSNGSRQPASESRGVRGIDPEDAQGGLIVQGHDSSSRCEGKRDPLCDPFSVRTCHNWTTSGQSRLRRTSRVTDYRAVR